MVANPRKKTGPSRIRPLNRPAPVQVREDERQMPSRVVLRNREGTVTSVLDVWEIVDEWWRASPVSRRYYHAAIEGGESITLFRDLASGAWYEQQV